MKIIQTVAGSDFVRFKDINIGECFKFEHHLCLKLSDRQFEDNSFDLNTNKLASFVNNDEGDLLPVKTEIIVK